MFSGPGRTAGPVNKAVFFLLIISTLFTAAGAAAGAETAADYGGAKTAGMKLLLSQDDIDRIVWNINNVEWYGARFEKLKSKIDAWRGAKLHIPEKGGGWSHNYIAPDTGRRLKYDPAEPHRHLDPSTGKYHTGEQLDASWRERTHRRNIDIAFESALLYHLTGEDWYAGFARSILVRYAKNYSSYPPQGGPAGLGRITAQSLGEAGWLIRACATLDLLAGGGALSQKDIKNIVKHLIVPAAEHVRMFPFGIHNIQVWHSVSMLAAGLVSGRESLVEFALEDLEKQIEQGITDEGLWYERSVGYHFFVLKPFQALAAVCRNSGLEVCDRPKLKKLFTGIVPLVMPDGSLPALNDGGRGNSIHDALDSLVTARWAYGDASLDSIINHLGASEGWSRTGDAVFMYYMPPAESPPEWSPPHAPAHLPDTGITVLRLDGQYALLKYNPPCGGHDHYDRLGLIYYTGGRELLPDRGTVAYGHPLYRSWYRTTEAHNTIMVDGKQQLRVPCDPLAYENNKYLTGVSVECKGLYEHVNAMRSVALTGAGMIDVTYVEAARDHTIDWFLHTNSPAPAPKSVYNKESPNPEMKFSVRMEFINSMTSFWIRRDENQENVATTFTPFSRSTVYEGTATGFYPDGRLPVMMWRQEGDQALFVACSGTDEVFPEARLEGDEVVVEAGGLTVRINVKTGEIKSQK